jgi:hypothetical protein
LDLHDLARGERADSATRFSADPLASAIALMPAVPDVSASADDIDMELVSLAEQGRAGTGASV